MAKRAKAATTGDAIDLRLQALADAISAIEGGSASNPGNIRDTSGGIGTQGDLLGLLDRAFVSQTSRSYNVDMTFTEFAWMYVAGTAPGKWEQVTKGDNPDNWAAFVAGRLGVSVDTKVWDYLNS